ncbi:MAG: class I SAM-dependent methyltransferase [Myxococcota bacterium]|nr:class I SAM-dependent methyltransferase [Myxococcota bacterium]
MLSQEVIGMLCCPNCEDSRLSHEVFEQASADDIIDGVVWCVGCRHWYPVEGRLLDFMIGALAYDDDRTRFWTEHETQLLSLGLEAGAVVSDDAKDLQKIQQKHFDWWADENNQSYFEYEGSSFWRAADLIAFEPWKQEIPKRTRLLDVGCAQGRSTFKFMNCDLDIIGIDVSKALIRQAIARYQAGDFVARAVFIAADASRFPIRNEQLDTVLVYGVLHHLADPGAACREISRVLKPGGSYIGQENNETIFRKIFDLLQFIFPQWQEEAGPEATISADRFREWFRETPVEIDSETSVFLPPHLCNMMSLAGSHRSLVFTDRIARAIPFLRNQGGVILVRGNKA